MAKYIYPDTMEFPAAGGSQRLTIENTDYYWEVDPDDVSGWVSLEPWSGSGQGAVTVTCARNGDAEARHCTVVFKIWDEDRVSYGEDLLQIAQEAGDGYVLQYEGEFPDIKGNVWRCEILRTGYTGDSAGLEFPADQPLAIEWPSINFEDVVWGSSATLRIVSPGDRTYIDLYTIEPGAIRLDVYKNGDLYWSGTLDPEFYEEPYERLSGYEVALTFTDFGILDRLKYDLKGVQSLRDIIDHAVVSAAFKHKMIDMMAGAESHFAVQMALAYDGYGDDGSSIFGPSPLCVRSDNFTDEEGEVSTIYEALEGVLRPLGLRIVQRGGEVTVFDTAGVGAGVVVPQVVWTGDSQTLGVDRVYNGVKVTFSPYVADDMIQEPLAFGASYSLGDINTSATWPGDEGDDPKYYTYTEGQQYDAYSFTMFVSAAGSGVVFGEGAAIREYAHILPVYGAADECDCIPMLYTTAEWQGGNEQSHGLSPLRVGAGSGAVLLRLPRIFIPHIADADERGRWMLRVKAELLVDARYNPFDEDDEYHADAQDGLKKNSAMVGTPLFVNVYPSEEGGDPVIHYNNDGDNSGSYTEANYWGDGAAARGDAWMTFYNADDFSDNAGGAGVGWKGNRHYCKPWYMEKASPRWRNAADGEYLRYPPQGGWLEVSLGVNVMGFKYEAGADYFSRATFDWATDMVRWVMFRGFSVEVVRNDLTLDGDGGDDIEYSGVLDPAAQDDLGIDTVCGTGDDVAPAARGLYVNSDGSQVSELYRAGVTARIEDLLIGSLYSQYAERKTVLTGEAEIPEALLLTEQNQEGKTFILTADSEDIRMGVSDIEIRELGEDTYTPQ